MVIEGCRPEFPPDAETHALAELGRRCFAVDRAARPTFEQILAALHAVREERSAQPPLV